MIAGGSSPFPTRTALGPMTFMRRLLCIAGDPPVPTCGARVAFDIWSHHPYTPGAPTNVPKPAGRGDRDLPEMKRILDAAIESGKRDLDHELEFWVTELAGTRSRPTRGASRWRSTPAGPRRRSSGCRRLASAS